MSDPKEIVLPLTPPDDYGDLAEQVRREVACDRTAFEQGPIAESVIEMIVEKSMLGYRKGWRAAMRRATVEISATLKVSAEATDATIRCKRGFRINCWKEDGHHGQCRPD